MKILVIAPHADDEVLGVGGTIAKNIDKGALVYVCVVTKGVEPIFSEREVEQVREECKKAHRLLGIKKTFFLDFPAAMLETVPRYKLNKKILDVIQSLKPNEIYIPHRGDMQLDHKIVTDACMVALRPKYGYVVPKIYAYETLSETGWNIPNVMNDFIPNVYEDVSQYIKKKMEALNLFQSQISAFPAARSIDAIEALARFRGATINVMAAEAFCLIREIK